MADILTDIRGNKLWVGTDGSVFYKPSNPSEANRLIGAITTEGGMKVYNDVRDLSSATEWPIIELVFRLNPDMLVLQDKNTHKSFAAEARVIWDSGWKMNAEGVSVIMSNKKLWRKV